jgi:hypothetical protein
MNAMTNGRSSLKKRTVFTLYDLNYRATQRGPEVYVSVQKWLRSHSRSNPGKDKGRKNNGK